MAWIGVEKGKTVIIGHDDNGDGGIHIITVPNELLKLLTGKDKVKELMDLETLIKRKL